MRYLAPYTRATLRGIRRRRGPNSTSALLSRVVNTLTPTPLALSITSGYSIYYIPI